MSHIHGEKTRLLSRIRRIRGQVGAIEKGIQDEQDCNKILQTIAACRGALNSLMAQVVEGHVLHHVLAPERKPTQEQTKAARQLLAVIHSYLK